MSDSSTPRYWNARAESFDDEPDHGLTDIEVNNAWRALLTEWLPATPCRIVDIGCGTGSLSVLAAQLGHDVVGLDFSAAMIEGARLKARRHGLPISFSVADASAPPLRAGSFDVVLARHVIWTLPNPTASMATWASLLDSDGRIVAVEGYWEETGFKAERLSQLLNPYFAAIDIIPLSSRRELWGKNVDDHRYALICSRPQAG